MRARAHRLPTYAPLAITSMMDLLTIVLVFLLQNFETTPSAETFGPVELPTSTSEEPLIVAVTLTVSREGLAVDGVPLLQVAPSVPNGWPPGVVREGILPDLAALLQARRSAAEGNADPEDVDMVGQINLVADRGIPYAALRDVLSTASRSGFTRFRFATAGGAQ